ncbi:NUDIX domain-containing protein [Halocatena marina]|uniref:NUDIX domain-containing protein n=1 Tax=Halocatena marina TaxID=2934937 RepID=A0ABD5YYS4_9EURY
MPTLKATFCPHCGRELTTQWYDNKERPYCDDCDSIIFQRPIPCADVAVVDGSQVLLIKRGHPPDVDKWGLPGGVIEVGEPPEVAAARELKEETNIEVFPSDLLLIDGYALSISETWYNIGYIYVVAQEATSGTLAPGPDVKGARFWTLEELDTSDQELRSKPDEASRIQAVIKYVQGIELDNPFD